MNRSSMFIVCFMNRKYTSRQLGDRLLSLLLVLPSVQTRDVFPYLALVKIALLLYCATQGLLSRWKHQMNAKYRNEEVPREICEEMAWAYTQRSRRKQLLVLGCLEEFFNS